MFSEWDFDTWTGSLVILLIMGGLVIGFGMFVTALLSRILGKEPDMAATLPVRRTPEPSTIREAA